MRVLFFRHHVSAVLTMAALAWALLGSEARAAFLSVDFGAAGFGQAGFQNVTPSTTVMTASFPFATPTNVSSGTTTVGLTSSAGNFRVIDRGTQAGNSLPSGGTFNNLYRDAVLPNDGATLTIAITGLNASTSYLLDLYSYDAQPVARQETFTVTGGTLTGGTPAPSGNAVTFTPNTVPNNQYDDVARLTITSTAAGSITVVQSSTSTVPFLNGLEITAVPEPTSVGLLGVGGFGLLARRRRRA